MCLLLHRDIFLVGLWRGVFIIDVVAIVAAAAAASAGAAPSVDIADLGSRLRVS